MPRNVRQHKRRGRADHCGHVWVVLLVDSKDREDHLHLVSHRVVKQRPDRPVNHATSEHSLIGCPALALDKARTLNFSCGIEPLFVVDGEREKRDVPRFRPQGNGGKYHRVPILTDHGTRCLQCELPDRKRELLSAKLEFILFLHSETVLSLLKALSPDSRPENSLWNFCESTYLKAAAFL